MLAYETIVTICSIARDNVINCLVTFPKHVIVYNQFFVSISLPTTEWSHARKAFCLLLV